MLLGMNTLPLENTLEVIAASCEAAEQAVRQQIERKYDSADEEFITRLFHGELRFALKTATEKRAISDAFHADLTAALSGAFDSHTLQNLSADIFAESRFHKRSVEAKTGADFGLLIVRPFVQYTSHSLAITMAKQGLLCQAKLRHEDVWGTLTKTQKKVLKNRTQFLSLVLYSYADEKLTKLNPIEWQPCNGVTLRKLSNWLKYQSFPKKLSTADLVRALGSGELGTDDAALIRDIIDGSNVPVIVITIDWPDDRRPDPEIQASILQAAQQQVQEIALIRHS
jgi:hypothetical protein